MRWLALFVVLTIAVAASASADDDSLMVAESEGDMVSVDTLQPDPTVVLKRGIINRMFGKCETKTPADQSCWSYQDNMVTVDLTKLPELNRPATAVHLDGKSLPLPVLIMRGDDDQLRAYHNSCGHGGRRLDPVPGAATLQCCSVGHATYDYDGTRLTEGPTRDVRLFETTQEDMVLTVFIPEDIVATIEAEKAKKK